MISAKRKYSPLQMKGGGLTDAISTEWNNISSVFKPFLIDVFRLLPDSVLFGSMFFALVSQSYPMAIFVLSMMEATGVGIALNRFTTYLDISRSLPAMSEDPEMCFPSTFGPTLETLISFSSNSISSGMPSFPIYFLATASAYVVGSVWSQKRELEALGPEYAARFYIAVAVTALLLFALMTYRISFGCDGVGTIILSFFFGIVIGSLLIFQNNSLFGRDSTNFSGIPLLRERTKDGKPLYVCTEKGVA